MTTVKVSDLIVTTLAKHGINTCFSVTGGGSMHLNHSFSINERFEKPLSYLISENKDIETFKTILNIIFENNFEEVEGFSEFKLNQLSKGKSSFYNEFWNIDSYSKKNTLMD